MKWVPYFLILNLLDAGLSHYMIVAGYPVEEGNPIAQMAMDQGWGLWWIYKIFLPCALASAVMLYFSETSFTRIMKYCCYMLTAFMVYMIGLSLYLAF